MAYINNFYKVSDILSCSGQPSEAQLKELAAQKYQIIINLGLLDTLYALKDEKGFVKALNMAYYHIPVLFESPELIKLETFIKRMDQHEGKKIHIHCASNFRGICFTGLWLYYKGLKTKDEVMGMIEEFWHPDSTWQLFLSDSIAYIESQQQLSNKAS
jgi:protein tyrosine phosphatase (PTP) superfamily phosphohydrolase (DUF442 family)